MSLTLRHIRAFVEVARQGSFRRAAEKLFISQPALTITISQLEELVGVSLFNRTTRRINLTTDGENFLPIAERLVADFDRAISDLKQSAERRDGKVSIAVLPSMTINLLPDLLARFKGTNPETRIVLRDDNARGVQRQVLNNESDFGISNRWEEDSELEFTPLTLDPIGLVCPPDHPLGKSTRSIGWRKLEDYQFVGMSQDTGVNKLINAIEGCPEAVRSPEYEVLTMAALGGILEARLAITVLPLLAVPSHMHPSLVFRKLTNPRVERELCVVTRRDYPLSASAQKVRDMLLTETPRAVDRL
ncbi:MAG: LysR family transcriptional regulator [Gammaproteobacteria bacterium]|nr:LysR family transcriptional regulator [Gammaproteobacteria bacterium]MCP4982180.1 LysR family transcriptional regulator [Gammaproteobacteria bacterium]